MSAMVEKGLVAALASDTVRDAVRFGREKIMAAADVHFEAVDQVAKLVETLRSPVPTESSVLVSTAPLHQVERVRPTSIARWSWTIWTGDSHMNPASSLGDGGALA